MTIKADPTEFEGKRVLVSGGTKGLGCATVARFLAGGGRVITAARGHAEPIDGVELLLALEEDSWLRVSIDRKEGKSWPMPRWSIWVASTSWPM